MKPNILSSMFMKSNLTKRIFKMDSPLLKDELSFFRSNLVISTDTSINPIKPLFIQDENQIHNSKLEEMFSFRNKGRLLKASQHFSSIESSISKGTVDYSLIPYYYSISDLDHGSLKSSLDFITKSIEIFNEANPPESNNDFVLELNLTKTEIRSAIFSNFDEMRKEFLKIIAAITILKEKKNTLESRLLLIKAYTSYIEFLNSSYNFRASVPYYKILKGLLTPETIETDIGAKAFIEAEKENLLIRGKCDAKSIERVFGDFVQKHKEKGNTRHLFYTYLNCADIIYLNNPTLALTYIDKALSVLTTNDNPMFFINAYIKKMETESQIGRSILAEHNMNKVKELSMQNYPKDSLEKARVFQNIASILISRERYNLAKEYLSMSSNLIQGSLGTAPNILNLVNLYIGVKCEIPTGIANTLVKYGQFRNVHESVFGKESEMLYLLNFHLLKSNMSKVYKLY